MKKPTLSIIILAHNKLEYTRKCIESVKRYTDPSVYEVILIDNASNDDTSQYFAEVEDSNNFILVRNKDNLGFVNGNNHGVTFAHGTFLLFLNNDTEVQVGWLEPILDTIQQSENVGIVGAKLIYPDGRLQEAGGLLFSDGTAWNYGRFEDADDPQYTTVRDVDYCSGAALLIRANLFQAVGGFDRRFAPAYWEDVDLCFAVRQAGYRVVYQPASVIIHHEGITSGTNLQTGFKRFQEVNKSRFLDKWASVVAQQPELPEDFTGARRISDRRYRNSQHILIVVRRVVKDATVVLTSLAKSLLHLGYHITIASENSADSLQFSESDQLQLFNAGVPIYSLANLEFSRSEDKAFMLQNVVQQRQYDLIFLWSERPESDISEILRYNAEVQICVSLEPEGEVPVFVPWTIHRGIADSKNNVAPLILSSHDTVETTYHSQIEPFYLTYGRGCYDDEGGWRWLAKEGLIFVWSQALRTQKLIRLNLVCDEASSYTRFPFKIEIYVGFTLLDSAVFQRSQEEVTMHARLESRDDDVCLRIESQSSFVPKQLHDGDDERELAVRLTKISILQIVI